MYSVKEIFYTLQGEGARAPRFANLARVTVRRDSCGQSCSYTGR